VLKGRTVHESVRLIAIPGTPKILAQMIDEGIAKTLLEAARCWGRARSVPAWAPIWGSAANEVAFHVQPEFCRQDGHPTSRLYLASPWWPQPLPCWDGLPIRGNSEQEKRCEAASSNTGLISITDVIIPHPT